MTRTLRPLGRLVLLAALGSTGCASWRSRNPPGAADTATAEDGGLFQGLFQSLSDASLHGWNSDGKRPWNESFSW